MKSNNLNKQFMSLISSLFVLLIIVSLSNNAYSKEAHSLDDITRTAHDFVLNQIEISDDEIQIVIGQLDGRLRLHKCTVPIEAYSLGYKTRRIY
ncbi:MAG: hypothetical protein O7D86_15075 [Proteobacteria bacterium]|nr:hypothetical protein [Pseudomonadota bacterium]